MNPALWLAAIAASTQPGTWISTAMTATTGTVEQSQAVWWIPNLDAALAKAGLTQQTARFSEPLLGMFRKGEFAPSIYTAMSADPWRIPMYTAAKRSEFIRAAGKPSDLISSGGAWVGWGVRRTLLGNPNHDIEQEAQKPGALTRALEQMKKEGRIPGPIPAAAGVPAETQKAAALVLLSIRQIRPMMQASLREVGSVDQAHALLQGPEGADFGPTLELYRRIDPSPMAAAAHDLSHAVQTAAEWAEAVPSTAAYSFSVHTTQGAIQLTGGAGEATASGGTLLAIDTGGDDTTIGAASAWSKECPVSVSIDTAGNDKYLSDPALETTSLPEWDGRKDGAGLGPAAARLGIAILVDSRGDDLYRSHLPSMGSGSLGFGILLDKEGSDVYDAYKDSIGFGLFGGGIVEDLKGDDRYAGFTQIQGCGLTQGLGVLVDREGRDDYAANSSVIDFPSPQSAQHNVSMAQGAAYGRRADFSDGRSLAGGVGILMDGGGDDVYTCGVFGQGVGYWMGVGLLWDIGGNDRHLGQWYVQGASAHFAIGILEDEMGNDAYTAPMNMAQGAGHDFSIGLLRDAAGDDRYAAPNLSLGAANANSLGWLLELSGNDVYSSSGITLGRASENSAGSLRERAINLGVFMDLAGADGYPSGLSWAKDGAISHAVISRGPTPEESAQGVFWDKG